MQQIITAARGDDAAVPSGRGLDPSARPACEHGTRVRRAGYSKTTGKPFAGFWCPLTPGQCKPVWADVDQIIGDALDAWKLGLAPASEAQPDGVGQDAPPW